jgi:glycerol uptake operon antiterminator
MSTDQLSQFSVDSHQSEEKAKAVPFARSGPGLGAARKKNDQPRTFANPNGELRAVLESSRIIPAIRVAENVAAALASPSAIVFLMCGTPATVDHLVWRVRQRGKLPIVNLDLLPGFARDTYAVEFLAEAGAAGVISTHQDVLRAARSLGLITVQRTFAIDSAALGNCLRRLHDFAPDILELLPAFAGPVVLPKLHDEFPKLLVIGCGLVTTVRQAEDLVQQGMLSVSVHDPSLWIV